MNARHWTLAAFAAVVCTASPSSARAQVDPGGDWHTITTAHFRVHFQPPLEEQARRAAVNVEHAYAQLAAELHPPRGTIDLVIADNVDYSNGYATPLPTNRIVVYAHPPVETQSLRYYSDWNTLVDTHELTHIFHLDRSRGWWGVAQHVFGRNPALFPNTYDPAWLTEGLAVYYESRLTGTGRIAGSAHRMIASAAARDASILRLDQLSLGTPLYPGGQAAYAYGSLVVDFLARTRGPDKVGDFVEQLSRQTIPFGLDRASRRVFGITIEQAWREWRDSVQRAVPAGPHAPIAGWRELTRRGWEASFPRWRGDSTLLYAANPGRETPGLYALSLDGRERRLGRRNDVDANSPVRGGGIVFAQADYVNLYEFRSDLYATSNGHTRRLTTGARLSAPDARADGAIVAVRAMPATTALVRVSADGRSIAPITTPMPDVQWSEPRWSPDGTRIAAARWTRGGGTAIIVLDTTGQILQTVSASRFVESQPAWSADGREIVFSSDRSGLTELYVASADSSGGSAPRLVRRLSDAGSGIFNPALSPDGRLLAAVHFRADGFHVGVAPYDTTLGAAVPAADSSGGSLPAAERSTAAAPRYSPWRTLLPHYWMPVSASTDFYGTGTMVGALTSGEDVLTRHAYTAQAMLPLHRPSEPDLAVQYRYAGFRQPLIDVNLENRYEHYPVTNSNDEVVGTLSARRSTAVIAATVARARVRNYSYASVGGLVEVRGYTSDPAPLLRALRSDYFRSLHTMPGVIASVGFSNAQRPSLSISPEDGVSLGVSASERWLRGASTMASTNQTVIGVARGYKSLDLPGYAHHVVAVRAAGGWRNSGTDDRFDVGGTSGSSLELVPGYFLGTSSESFGVRGFPSGTLQGIRAGGASAEYRLPLTVPARGYRLLPVFIGRTSLAAFTDAGLAWCPAALTTRYGCPATRTTQSIASAGAELSLDTSLQYDVPFRFRFGAATPVRGRELFGGNVVHGYFTAGLSF